MKGEKKFEGKTRNWGTVKDSLLPLASRAAFLYEVLLFPVGCDFEGPGAPAR
jgi:hypothetical protein